MAPGGGGGGEGDVEGLVRLVGTAARRVPALADAGIVRGVTGVYDMTPDGRPMLGELPGLSGLVLAAGFSGTGFKISPAVGEAIAVLVTGHASRAAWTSGRSGRAGSPRDGRCPLRTRTPMTEEAGVPPGRRRCRRGRGAGGRRSAARHGAAGAQPARSQLHQRGRVRPRTRPGAVPRLVLRRPRRRPHRAGLLPGRRRVRGKHHRGPDRRGRPGRLLQPVPSPGLAAGAPVRRPPFRCRPGSGRAPGRRPVRRQHPLPLPRLDLRAGRDAAGCPVPARAARVPGRAVPAPGGGGHLGRLRLRPARAARQPGHGGPAGGHARGDPGPGGRISPGRPARRGPAALRRGRQLEGHPGELQRVLPLRARPPGAV